MIAARSPILCKFCGCDLNFLFATDELATDSGHWYHWFGHKSNISSLFVLQMILDLFFHLTLVPYSEELALSHHP